MKIIKNSNFIHEIENYHPLSMKYKSYWKELKRRCIEGYWHEGKWMPGSLYYYINFGRILMHVNGAKSKSVGRPWLRDVEWEKAYVYMEAKGFSGFEGDSTITCSRWVEHIEAIKDPEEKLQTITSYIKRGKITATEVTNPDEFPLNPKLKQFANPRLYLRKIHSQNLGKALFKNNAHNVVDLETRRIGKSYYAGNGMANHNFLFDGATDYDVYLEALRMKMPLSSETLVGAIDAKYTKDLLAKSQLGLDNIPGGQTVNGIYYPSPIAKKYRGSFAPSKYIEAAFEEKINGTWVTSGSRSKIHNRSFADNPLAGNGTGPNLIILEEYGFMTNLIESLGALKDATYEGADKFGVIWMTGTGGQGDEAAISDAKEVFYNPKQYDCLCFDNIWEESEAIGYFVPYQKRLDEFRDEEGIIDEKAAMVGILAKREQLAKGKNQKALLSESQNNPIKPSEAFMISQSNIFPVAELQEHVNWLKSHQQDGAVKGQCGELVYVPKENGEVELRWLPDLKNKLYPCEYGLKKEDNATGCIQIWEHPKTYGGVRPPFGLYLAGTDPYDQDQSTTASLGSTFIYKTFYTEEGIYEWPVAEYTGRPATAKEYYENVRRLLEYYNAIDLYENERNGIKMYFEHKNSLYLLAKQPTILKSTENSSVQRNYGIHMTDAIKKELEIYTRDWLLEDSGDGRLNLHKIYSIPLLEELINYNDVGNFDRVIAFMLCILHKLQNYHNRVKVIKKDEKPSELSMFLNRTKKFY